MEVTIKKYLFDIKLSIEAVSFHLKGSKNFFEFKENLTIKRAIERELEILGEAVNRILKIEPNFELNNARRIVDTRNYIIHAYDAVDDETIWGIVINHLPKLKCEIESLLAKEE